MEDFDDIMAVFVRLRSLLTSITSLSSSFFGKKIINLKVASMTSSAHTSHFCLVTRAVVCDGAFARIFTLRISCNDFSTVRCL